MGISATTGIMSGIDYASLIDGLIKIERQPIDLIKSRQSALEATKFAYSTLSTKLKSLQSAAYDLKSELGFKVFKADVSDTTIFTATASSTASAGAYTIRVEQLAQKHSIANVDAKNAASSTTVIGTGAGSFTFKVGSGSNQTVSIDATTTLQGLADSINALNAGAAASIINTGSAGYKLILTSNTEGASNGITIVTDETTLDMDNTSGTGGVTTITAAQDAQIRVGGAAGILVTRSSNTITDVIGGVTLNLKKAQAGTDVSLTVSRDTDKIKEKITNLVSKYNDVMGYIKANNRYDSETKTKGSLYTEILARDVQEKLRSTFQSTISGLSNPDMNQLVDAGISVDKNGSLSVDSTKLGDALSSNFNDVMNLFIDGTSTDGFGVLIYNTIDAYVNAEGSVTKKTSSLGKTIDSLDSSIEKKELWLTDYQEKLRLQFSALETAITRIKSQGSYLTSMLG